MLSAQAVGAVFVGRDERPGRLQRSPEAYRPVPHCKRGPRAARRPAPRAPPARAPRRAARAPRRATRRRTPRRAARRGRRARAPASFTPSASASSELTPTSGSPLPCASARAVEIPIRSPVKLPGPTPTAIRSTCSQPSPACSSAASAAPRSRFACPGRTPGSGSSRTSKTVPDASRTPATVAVVAVSRPRTITSPPASGGRRPRGRARRGARSAARRAAPRAHCAPATPRT